MWFLGILLVFSMISVVLVPRDDANAFNTKELQLTVTFHQTSDNFHSDGKLLFW